MTKSRTARCALAAAVLLLTGACMSDDNGKNAPLPRLSRERATRWAEEHTARMAEAAAVALDAKTAESVFEDCVGKNDEVVEDGRYSLYYTVYADVPTERHSQVVRKVRADLEAEGYEISGYREYQDDYASALVDARDPETRFSLGAESAGRAGVPSKKILFSVRTPCMIPPGATQQTL